MERQAVRGNFKTSARRQYPRWVEASNSRIRKVCLRLAALPRLDLEPDWALLLVALLRSNKIPSRMAYHPVRREFMRPALGEACQTLTETINHCFAQVQLKGEWVTVDATLDTPTYRKLFEPSRVSWTIEWNGKQDMELYTEHIAGPVVVIEDIDAAIQQDLGNIFPPPSEAEAFFGHANRQMWQAVAA